MISEKWVILGIEQRRLVANKERGGRKEDGEDGETEGGNPIALRHPTILFYLLVKKIIGFFFLFFLGFVFAYANQNY